jgi:hypothetical protein
MKNPVVVVLESVHLSMLFDVQEASVIECTTNPFGPDVAADALLRQPSLDTGGDLL